MPVTFKTMTMKFRDSPEDPWSASLVQAVVALDPAYEAMGIVEDGDTATHNISSGQYVIWKGSLYTASSNITSGTTLSGSNLTAVSNGGFNSLENTFEPTAITLNNITSGVSCSAYKIGRIILVYFMIDDSVEPTSGSNWTNLFRIPSAYRQSFDICTALTCRISSGDQRSYYTIFDSANGYVRVWTQGISDALKNGGGSFAYYI